MGLNLSLDYGLEVPLRALAFLTLAFALAFPLPARAEHEEEGWVRARFIQELDGQIGSLETASEPSTSQLVALDNLWFSLQDRAESIRVSRFEGLVYSQELLLDLELNKLPRLRALLARFRHVPSRQRYDQRRAERLLEIRGAETRLRIRRSALQGDAITRLLSLAAFARSAPIGGGRIGSWNPASPAEIQESSLKGLGQVLANVEALGNRPFDLEFLRTQQALLLGAAAHHYSLPGEILHRVLSRQDGRQVPILEHIQRWIDEQIWQPRSSEDALATYARMMHLHFFGDANRRVAEVAKQQVLRRMNLPALLTPEKTSIETYRDSLAWGQTDFSHGVLAELRQTIGFLVPFEQLRDTGWRLVGASLAGGVVIAELRTAEGGRAVAVIPRILEASGELPPAQGGIVMATRDARDLRLHLGVDGWASPEEHEPRALTRAPREGDIQTSFPFFFRELKPGERGELHFALHYQHANGNEVWFNNDGRDYHFSPCRAALE